MYGLDKTLGAKRLGNGWRKRLGNSVRGRTSGTRKKTPPWPRRGGCAIKKMAPYVSRRRRGGWFKPPIIRRYGLLGLESLMQQKYNATPAPAPIPPIIAAHSFCVGCVVGGCCGGNARPGAGRGARFPPDAHCASGTFAFSL